MERLMSAIKSSLSVPATLGQILKDTKATLEDLKTEVSSVRSNQERDFRLMFGALIAVALGLAGLLAKGFHWL